MKKLLAICTAILLLANPVSARELACTKAGCIRANTSNFDGNLSATDTRVQSALETLDDMAVDERMALWHYNATIVEVDAALATAGKNQVAGYVLNQGTGGIAGPQIYLMCST